MQKRTDGLRLVAGTLVLSALGLFSGGCTEKPGGPMSPDKRVQEMTGTEIRAEHAKVRHLINTERKRQAIAAGLWIASGRIGRVDWPNIRDAIRDDVRWQRQSHELLTEAQVRRALAFGPLVFVLLGAPVGMLFARRDFLSAFITCFLPIIVVYYPLLLSSINAAKGLKLTPLVVWSANGVVLVIAMLLFRRLARN